MIKTSAAFALLVAAASSNAALITLGGDFSGTFGNGNLIAINSASQRTFSQNLSDASVSGTVRFSNTLGAGDQSFELALDNFSYTSTSTQSRTLPSASCRISCVTGISSRRARSETSARL